MGIHARIQSAFVAVKAASAPRLSRFQRDEDGTLIVFALMLFTLMIMMGGLAVDLMRGETTRTNLQQSLDRCTLTAAALTQHLDPDGVVRDCMLKSGLSDQLADVNVVDGMNFRSVQATGVADTRPMFLHLLGIDNFDVYGASAAEQGLSNVEIVLVLDVSGSMTGQKIANLKTAATEFVDTMFAQDVDHRVSIAIVPYNAQVNLGPLIAAKYNVTYDNRVNNNDCLELPTSVYAAPGISRTDPLPEMAYADIAYGTSLTNGYVSPVSGSALPNYSNAFCKSGTVNVVRLPSNNAAQLKSQINALQAGGNTSITLGMKWGLAMIDPSARPMYSEFIATGDIPATMPGRPFDYNDPQAMKVIVLMTDGEHVAHDRVNDPYKAGPSPIFLSVGDGNYSIYFAPGVRPASAGANGYYVPHLNTWQATPWNSGAGAAPQDWNDIWAHLKLSYVAWQFYARALGTDNATRNAAYNAQIALMKSTYESVTDMDAHLQDSCNMAKANNVIVYGIAVEAPQHGQDVIRACATSDAHYFDASALTISTAFRSIATNITQLKLTQ